MKKKEGPSKAPSKRRPALSPEAQESRIAAMAMNLVEEQLENGTISSTVLAEIIRRNSTKHRLENEILERQKELIVAKTENLKSSSRMEELYAEAMNVMRQYSGKDDSGEND